MPSKRFKLFVVAVLINIPAFAQVYPLTDAEATTETRWLYGSLQRLIGAGVLIGHHDDMAYGFGWRDDEGRSDVKSVSGSYPALYGWDLARLETGSSKDINSIAFARERGFVQQVYVRGGVNTFCWHLNNPVNGSSAWDTSKNVVAEIIPGGAYHAVYQAYLDRIAQYLTTLKGSEGEPIPILLRPFHELTGNWFWWGRNRCTPAEFKSLWRFTVDYLRDKKKLHNLIIVYSTGSFSSEADFMERYPGDDVVDAIGFDDYCDADVAKFTTRMNRQLALLKTMGQNRHKLTCLAETGYDKIPDPTWWTQTLLPLLAKYPVSYTLLWRNDGPGQYFVPYPGQASATDFKAFAADNNTMLQNRLTWLQIYGRPILP